MLGLKCSTVCSKDVDVDTYRLKIRRFEMWIQRIIEKISWHDKVTNEDVLRRGNEDRQILPYLAKIRSMDWIRFKTRQTSA